MSGCRQTAGEGEPGLIDLRLIDAEFAWGDLHGGLHVELFRLQVAIGLLLTDEALAILLDRHRTGIGLHDNRPHQPLRATAAGHDALDRLIAVNLPLPVQLHDGLHRHHQQQAEQQQQKDLVGEYLFDHDTSPCWME